MHEFRYQLSIKLLFRATNTLEFIGGLGGAPQKVSPQVASMAISYTIYGYFTGTNDVYMGIYGHICIQIMPPYLVGGFRGAEHPESTFAPPYKLKRSHKAMKNE